MPQREPNQITSDLLDALNVLAGAHDRDDTEIKQIEFRAQALRTSNPASHFMILGICESLRLNPEGVKRNFELALSHGAGSATVQNYIIALHEAGDFESAEEILLRSKERLSNDPDSIQQILTSALNVGRPDVVADLEERMRRMNLTNSFEWKSYLDGLTEQSIDHAAVGEIIREGRKFLADKGFHRLNSSYSFSVEYGTSPHLTQVLPVARCAQDAHALELSLQERLYEVAESLRVKDGASPLDALTISLSTEGFMDERSVHP